MVLFEIKNNSVNFLVDEDGKLIKEIFSNLTENEFLEFNSLKRMVISTIKQYKDIKNKIKKVNEVINYKNNLNLSLTISKI